MRLTTPRLLAAAAFVLLPLAAACESGDGDDPGDTTTAATGDPSAEADLSVGSRDSLEFDQELYQAEAGELDVVLHQVGESSLPHTLVIEDVNGFKLSVSGRGDSDEGTVDLEAGEYVLFCDIAGHRSAGMQARLVVE